jgi:hypothetical protein
MLIASAAKISAILLLAGFVAGVFFVVRFVFSSAVEDLERKDRLAEGEAGWTSGDSAPPDVEGKRCSICGEWIDDAFEADLCPECDLPFHLSCESDHRCHQEWVAEDE